MTTGDTLVRSNKSTGSATTTGSGLRRIWTLVVTCMGVALVVSSMVALNTALGDIALSTAATQTQLTWVVDGYTIVLACLLLPAGAIGDRYGRRRALLMGMAIFTVASIAPVIFDHPLPIIVARTVAGAGAAFVMPSTLSLLTAAYPRDERGKAVGIWAGVAGSGAVIGMLGAGGLLAIWPWQSIFLALGAVGALVFVLACTVSPSRDSDAPRVDWPGALLIGSAVAVFVFGLIEAPARGWTHPAVYCCIVAGVVLAVVFGFVEFRRRKPLLDVRLFATPDFATGSATLIVLFMANFGIFYVIMQYFQLVMGYSPIRTAFAITPLMAGIVTLSALSFWYVPKLGLRIVVFTGLLLLSASFLWLRHIELSSSYTDLLWRFLLGGVGIGLCTAPTTSAIMSAVPDNKQGVASAVNDVAREIGAALGIAIAGSILAARYSDRLQAALIGFPEPVRGPSSDSLAQALRVANTLGPNGRQLAVLSETAFLDAMQSSLLVLGIIVAVAAVLIGAWSPGRDGQQLRLVRALISRARLNYNRQQRSPTIPRPRTVSPCEQTPPRGGRASRLWHAARG
jgi:EmrB/QacA subfamily drug resistance transporter